MDAQGRSIVMNSADKHLPVYRLIDILLKDTGVSIEEGDHLARCRSCYEVMATETLRAIVESDSARAPL